MFFILILQKWKTTTPVIKLAYTTWHYK